MRRAGAAAVLLLALLASEAGGQAAGTGWTHFAGGAAHAGVTDIGDRTLDVVASYRLDSAPEEDVAGLVWTPHGITGMASIPVAPIEVCQLFRISNVETGEFERFGPTLACPDGGGVNGYDPVNDAILLSIDGPAGDDLFQSWDARTGQVRWKNGPDVTAEVSGAQDSYDWFVDDVAVDEAAGIVYVPFSLDDVGRHRIQAMSLANGTTLWATSIPSTAFGGAAVPVLLGDQMSATAQNVEVGAITLTSTGLIVQGILTNPNAVNSGGLTVGLAPPVVAWFGLDGAFVNAVAAPAGDSTASATRPARSNFASASGTRGAIVIDDELLVIDPVNRNPSRIALPPGGNYAGYFAGPAWSREALLVPFATTAVIYPAGDTSTPRPWAGFEGSTIRTLFLAPPSDAYLVVSRVTRDGAVAELLRVDLASARTIDRIPLPFPPDEAGSRPNIVPLGDGRVLLVTPGGGAVLLGESSPDLRPRILVDKEYPAAGESLSLQANAPAVTREMTVAWGDGVLDTARPGATLTHAYEAPGRRVVRVLALYPDNRTATAEAVVNVGGTPPQELNVMQRAFAPDNQNLTFGILGLAATGVGGLIAYGRRLRRKSRLQTDLVELDRLRRLGKDQPYAAVRELATYRARIQRDLAEGALDDAQFTALSSEAIRLLGSLRMRVVGEIEGRASPRFRHQLDTALEDGALTPAELEALRAALASEAALTSADKERLRSLLDGWSASE